MIECVDVGLIFVQQVVVIDFEDIVLSLYGKLCKVVGVLLCDSLLLFVFGVLLEVEQDESQVSYFGWCILVDGLFDWYRLVWQLYDLVCVVIQFYFGVFCQVGEQKLIVWSVEVVVGNYGCELGSVLFCDLLWIVCGEDLLVLCFGQCGECGLYLVGM